MSGENLNGELGLGHCDNNIYSLQPVLAFEKIQIRKIYCSKISCALTFRGDVFVWGPLNGSQTPVPELINYFKQPIRDLKANSYIMTAIDIDNNLWGWNI